MTTDHDRTSLDVFIRKCRDLSALAPHVDRPTLAAGVRALAAEARDVASQDDLICRALLQYAVGRIVSDHGPLVRDAAASLVASLNCLDDPVGWHTALDRLSGAIDREAGGGCTESVCQILRVLDARFREPHLKLHDLASQVRLSPWHVTRLLKQQTGAGFATHLRVRRIEEARRLLTDPSLSIKEIAAAVGFSDASQFTRQFGRLSGVSPMRFRADRLSLSPAVPTTRTDKRSQDRSTHTH